MKKRINLETKKMIIFSFTIALIIIPFLFIIIKKLITSLIFGISIFIVILVYYFVRKNIKESTKVKKMENAFPDFLQLMASNLRAGITIDHSLLLSSRKEFAPLDQEINKLGKDIITGEKVEKALYDMSERIKSEKISKTINLLTSGIKSGGNLSVLLEETSRSMKERSFVEKKAASNVLMYVIFIFFATAIGAPILFALSSVLISILTSVLSGLPTIETNVNLPFTLSKISISTTFITYFSLIFLIVTDILGCLILGLVTKGSEKEGTKFIIPLMTVSILVFVVFRLVILSYFSDIFA